MSPNLVENLLTSDESAAWYTINADRFSSWHRFKSMFIKHFKRSDINLCRHLYSDYKKPEESFSTFVCRLIQTTSMLNNKLSFKETTQILVQGCRTELRRTVRNAAQRVRSLGKLIEELHE